MTCAAERLATHFGHYIIGPVDRSPSPRTYRSIILPTVADDSMWQAWTMGGSSIRGRLPQQRGNDHMHDIARTSGCRCPC